MKFAQWLEEQSDIQLLYWDKNDVSLLVNGNIYTYYSVFGHNEKDDKKLMLYLKNGWNGKALNLLKGWNEKGYIKMTKKSKKQDPKNYRQQTLFDTNPSPYDL